MSQLQRRVELKNVTVELHNCYGTPILTLMVTSNHDHAIYTSIMNYEHEWTRLYNFAKDLAEVISKIQCEQIQKVINSLIKN
jgi:DNA replication protein DnaD